MKKWFKVFPVLLAIFALLVAGIACGGSSDNGNDGNDSGNDKPTEAVDNGNDGSDSGNDGSDSGNDGSDSGNDGSDSGNDGSDSGSGDDQEAIEGLLDEFMTALSEKDYDKAYELFPAEFDGESSAERLGQWADENKIFPSSWTHDEIEVDGDESIVKLNVTWEDPDDDDIMVITFNNEDGWYISHVDFENP